MAKVRESPKWKGIISMRYLNGKILFWTKMFVGGPIHWPMPRCQCCIFWMGYGQEQLCLCVHQLHLILLMIFTSHRVLLSKYSNLSMWWNRMTCNVDENREQFHIVSLTSYYPNHCQVASWPGNQTCWSCSIHDKQCYLFVCLFLELPR